MFLLSRTTKSFFKNIRLFECYNSISISGKFQNSGKFEINVSKDVNQISINHAITIVIPRTELNASPVHYVHPQTDTYHVNPRKPGFPQAGDRAQKLRKFAERIVFFFIILEKSSYSSTRERRNLLSSTTRNGAKHKPDKSSVIAESQTFDTTGATGPKDTLATEPAPVRGDYVEISAEVKNSEGSKDEVEEEPNDNINIHSNHIEK